jgi:hypothetical protein
LQNFVPLLLFPGPIFEQRYYSQKVVHAGAGEMGEENEFIHSWFQLAFPHQIF